MEENIELLKYIYQEDLYIVDEPETSVQSKPEIVEKIEPAPIEAPPPIVQEANAVTYFGSNEKGILILVNDPENEFLNQGDLDFLMKIIESGLRFTKHDFALVNTAKNPAFQAMDEIVYKYLLSFNVSISDTSGNEHFNLVKENDGKKILLTESLKDISTDTSKKTSLWKNLKIMFNI